MLERPKRRYTAVTATLFGMLALLALAMWGCGTSGYDNPGEFKLQVHHVELAA